MGDIADEHTDYMLFGRGHWRDDDGSDQEPRGPRCNRCGSTDVRWRQQGGKWVLFSLQPGVEHVCELDDSAFSAIKE